jgi:acyl carrier protein
VVEIRDRIIGIIERQLGLKTGEISLSTTFEELGVDSLELFRIIIEIEEDFGVQIEDPEMIRTVMDAVDFVERKTKKH